MRQVELADDDLDVHAEVVFVAENLDDAAARILGRRGPVGDLHIHHQAFEIVPLAAARLFAEDAVGVGLSALRCAVDCFAGGLPRSSQRRARTGHPARGLLVRSGWATPSRAE